MPNSPEHSAWTGKTDGTPWMQRSLLHLVRVLPLWFMYGIMALVIPFYIIFNHRGRLSSWRYFRHRLGYPVIRSAAGVYANMFNMGMVVLDRFAAYAGKKFRLDQEDAALFDRYSEEDDGFVILSSHVGNYEMTGYSLLSAKHMNVLVYEGETATVMANRSRLFKDSNVSMVPVREDLSHLFIMSSALSRGEIVSLPADRVFGSPKAVKCSFLGADATFPAGPFTLAKTREAKTLAMFSVKTGLRSYRVIARPINPGSVPAMAQEFAGELEKVVKRWPNQWYNFYDFWA